MTILSAKKKWGPGGTDVRPGPVFAYLIPGLLLVCALFFSGVPSFEFPGERDIVTVLGGIENGLSEDVDLSFGVETALRGDGPEVLFTTGFTVAY